MRKVWYMKFDSSAVELDNILVIIKEMRGILMVRSGWQRNPGFIELISEITPEKTDNMFIRADLDMYLVSSVDVSELYFDTYNNSFLTETGFWNKIDEFMEERDRDDEEMMSSLGHNVNKGIRYRFREYNVDRYSGRFAESVAREVYGIYNVRYWDNGGAAGHLSIIFDEEDFDPYELYIESKGILDIWEIDMDVTEVVNDTFGGPFSYVIWLHIRDKIHEKYKDRDEPMDISKNPIYMTSRGMELNTKENFDIEVNVEWENIYLIGKDGVRRQLRGIMKGDEE